MTDENSESDFCRFPSDIPNPIPYETNSWIRVFKIAFTEAIDEVMDFEKASQQLFATVTSKLETKHRDFEVQLKRVSENTVNLGMITTRWGLQDDYILTSLQLLKATEELLGEIATIQGDDKNLWYPWVK